MADQSDFGERKHIHISFDVFRNEFRYSPPRRNFGEKQHRDDHAAHAATLLGELSAALGDIPEAKHDDRLSVEGLKPGTIVEVGTMPPPPQSRRAVMKIPAGLEFPQEDTALI